MREHQRQGGFSLAEHGGDLDVAVWGPTLPSCLDAALAALATHVAEVGDEQARERRPVEVTGPPEALLVGLLDEAIALLDAEGLVACGFEGDVADAALKGEVVAVSLEGLALLGAPPKAATWHGAWLVDSEDGWRGHVILDL
ncbi:MAG: archease [Actinomycetota bacterium]